MQEFIQSAASKLGISEEKVSEFTGGLLAKVKEYADNDTVQSLISKVPGLDKLLHSHTSAEEPEAEPASSGASGFLGGLGGAGGMLGGLASKAQAAIGAATSIGDIAGLAQKAGLDASKASQYAKMFVDFLRQKVGEDTVNKVVSKVPGLAALIGE
jgi:hypothetical protein